ncbi:type II secretion system F family protein [Candidatus Saccharibacteria bacterium]|nr:type II secretion system F family protein [Candidatus Saccharibacteria bacterium]MCB9821234.1 type II secretion system F family protein [Candidatus Nomurabacteria bacterium]
MITFKYEARDPKTGNKITSTIQADSEQAAGKLLITQGLAPINIEPIKEKGGVLNRGNKVKSKDRIVFARELSTLINAGLPLVQSLRSVGDQTDSKPMKLVINQIIGDVEAGKSFSTALSRHPKIFNGIFISMVSAGEASGTLDRALERLAIQQEKDAEVISKVRGALVYPAIVMLVMGGVVTFMIVGVLPQVKSIYSGLKGASLPWITRLLLWISDTIIAYWWIALIVLILLVFFGMKWFKTVSGRLFADRFKLKVPPFNRLFMKLYMARFSRTAHTLIASGVPLIQVLEIVSKSINNVLVEASIKKGTEKVKGGKSLADSLQGDPNFLPLVPNMLRIGEESGSVEQMMERTAEYYEKEVDNEIKTISTIIEPVLMVILGVVAITIVAAILLPIYSLVGKNILG